MSVESRGAHKGGGAPYPPGRTLCPCGRLVALLTSSANHHEGFIPFGIPFLRNSKTRKKQELELGSRLIG